jgi:cyanophycin synthetase
MKNRDIEILRVQHLRGPSMWTYTPVLEVWVDIGALEDEPSNTIPGLYERLSSWLPSLVEHRCSYDERGGFLRRVKEGTWPAHILEHVTLELQILAGMTGGFGRARETSTRGRYKVVVTAWHEKVTREALQAGRDLVMAAIEDRPYDVAATLERLRDGVDRYCLGPSTACIVAAAEERGIPAIRLSEGNLVQLGYGSRQHRIWTAETDRTSAIAESISRDKDLTKRLLASCGVPVPEGRLVESAEDAWEAAEEIGVPVVVKPTDGNHGRGVFTDLTDRKEIEAAFGVARDEGSGVIVERCVPGLEHRLLVVGSRVVAAAKGELASVLADGRSTLRQLVETQLNADPRRGDTEDHPLNPVRMNSTVRADLARQGFTPESVPPAGQTVLIQRNGNVAFDVTDRVHPDVAATAALAARVVGLDIAGIDLVAEDIGQPLEAQAGAIVEVNAGPGLIYHLRPADGAPRPVGHAIVEHLFPASGDCRIPIVGVAGASHTTLAARLVAWMLHLAGRQVGLACQSGLYLNRRRIEAADATHWEAGQRLLMNRAIEAAVFENGARTILAEGLAYDRCQVGIVTDLGEPDEFAEFDVREPDQLYTVLRTQVDVVLPQGAAVLNALDPRVVEMAPLCDGEVIFYAPDASAPAIAEHRARGGRAVFVSEGQIVCAAGATVKPLVHLQTALRRRNGKPKPPLEAVLPAVAAAVALALPADALATGIETFDANGAAYTRSNGRVPKVAVS